VTLDAETGYAYIYLGEPSVGVVKESVSLRPDDGEPDALHSLVLDFDREGRLFGIEVLVPADATLRAELLEDAGGPGAKQGLGG
jgi:hypothetical protein